MRKMLDGEIEQEKKRYFEVGQKIHMFLLEHEEFWKNYICLDFELPKSEQEKQFCTDFINSKQKTKELKAFEAYKKSYSVSGARDEAIAYKGIEKHKKLTPYIKYLEYTQVYKDIIRPGELE
jgi:hypothetical protein